MSEKQHLPPAGITFLASLDRDLRTGLASEIRALWTHTSTALEGNTLKMGDTALVLQEGLTVSGKTLKDHQEIIGGLDGALRRFAGVLKASWLVNRRTRR